LRSRRHQGEGKKEEKGWKWSQCSQGKGAQHIRLSEKTKDEKMTRTYMGELVRQEVHKSM